jgi:hypothetical protein
VSRDAYEEMVPDKLLSGIFVRPLSSTLPGSPHVLYLVYNTGCIILFRLQRNSFGTLSVARQNK